MVEAIEVELQSVSKFYGEDKVVDAVSLHVNQGEIFVLIGPSGCGKTTTLKMINQLIPHTSGRILVSGTDVPELDPVELRRSIGYVIQYIGLLPHLTIRDNITFVLQLKKYNKKMQRERAMELIETVGLPVSYLDRHPRELSGGQQQRVGVARALAADPEILLMDEPFGAVDPITREQLQLELLRLQETIKKTIIFVTHDMQEAFKVGDRIGIMRGGRLVTIGTAMDIVRERDEFIRNFIGQGAIFSALDTIPAARAIIDDLPIVQEGAALDDDVLSLTGDWENIFIVDGQRRCLGYISLSEIKGQRKIDREKVTACPPPCRPGDSLKKVIEEMLWGNRAWLPVVSEEGYFLGIVSFQSCASLLVG